MEYLKTFFEGILLFFSPCILPMIPILMGYLLGENTKERKKLITNLLVFIAGFSLVFILLGILATTFGRVVGQNKEYINIFFGILLFFLGLNYTGLLRINILNKEFRAKSKMQKVVSIVDSFVMGIFFALVWSPCTGAYLTAALTKAMNAKTVLEGGILLLFYSLGIGLCIFLSGIFLSKLKNVFTFVKKNYKYINFFAGSIFIITGIIMLYNSINVLLIR